MLTSRECVKTTGQNPFVRVYLLCGGLQRVGTEMRGGVPPGWRAPYPSSLAPSTVKKPLGYLCGESGHSHDREEPESFWSQCGKMSPEEDARIIRRGEKQRSRGSFFNSGIKGSRCGTAPFLQPPCLTDRGPLLLLHSIPNNGPFSTIKSQGHPAYTFLHVMTTLSQFPINHQHSSAV